MVSEEIELNPGLERAGVEVVETDLGEFIVQLDDDHPSHIVMPIIHKDRHDVARLFRRTLNATEDEVQDAPRMAGLARRVLRAGFLRADMGISGGNFGVAASGSVCITTNEGNGRLDDVGAARARRADGHRTHRAQPRRSRRDAAGARPQRAPASS